MVEEDEDESPHGNADETDEEAQDTVRGHLSISLLYLLYSLLSPPTLSTPTPLCAYVHIITKGQQPLSPIIDDFAY
jgi:hypothetical protein